MADAGAAVPIRVVILDDHQMFSESVARLLGAEHDVEVVAVAATMSTALTAVAAEAPDVAVVDYLLPDGDGVEAARQILAASPSTRVLMLTGLADEDVLAAAIEAGCAGFVTKDRALQELLVAVRLVHAGDAYVPPRLLAALLPRFGRERRGLGSDLSSREREILGLVAQGLGNKAIAAELVLSVHTVRNHVQNVLTKLQAHSKLEAVAVATREGVLPR
jgi:DNA-binding NarL/FixJ family response regulator